MNIHILVDSIEHSVLSFIWGIFVERPLCGLGVKSRVVNEKAITPALTGLMFGWVRWGLGTGDQQPQVVTQSVKRGRRDEGQTTQGGAAKLTAGLWRERRSRMPEEQSGRPSRGGGSTHVTSSRRGLGGGEGCSW